MASRVRPILKAIRCVGMFCLARVSSSLTSVLVHGLPWLEGFLAICRSPAVGSVVEPSCRGRTHSSCATRSMLSVNIKIKGATSVTPEARRFVAVITASHLRPRDLVGECDRSEHGKHCPASSEQCEGRFSPLAYRGCARAIRHHRNPCRRVYC